ncbi:3-hydroxyacyl-CoA dehydrogenase [Diaphorobacter ruginosibacter]|uniref:3-hydroxyacyl-CoA dehydrogenase n=1 Tax=Diaphorobacter ruginosibacter TaxID=1715720 RepID=A0A7G9RQC0_9BURK|nr:3-hydroxyacyl-CoA dehydrogenase [Diaphorobacter ruginosibacter]QNN57795.1 3-hydroxyacyl-CoA dehydrogenase [Diaphorobacter ruginosibacter]
MQQHARPTIAIVGAGSIGVAFAIVFARTGHPVRLFDPDAAARERAGATFASRLEDLASEGLQDRVRIAAILPLLTVCPQLAEAVGTADLVIECAPERVEIKRALFAELDALAPETAILASASSFLAGSKFTEELKGRARCMVLHPGNPPYLIPVLEVVPAPYTSQESVERAMRITSAAGLKPVLVAREVEGFLFNRLQGAVLREAYCLVRDGVASVEDIDTVMRDGLGMRWSVIGPFETADLNTRGGIASHAEKMGPSYERMGKERGQSDPWTPELVAKVAAQRRAALPLDQWEERVAWRDRALMKVVKLRGETGE